MACLNNPSASGKRVKSLNFGSQTEPRPQMCFALGPFRHRWYLRAATAALGAKSSFCQERKSPRWDQGGRKTPEAGGLPPAAQLGHFPLPCFVGFPPLWIPQIPRGSHCASVSPLEKHLGGLWVLIPDFPRVPTLPFTVSGVSKSLLLLSRAEFLPCSLCSSSKCFNVLAGVGQ